MKRLCVFCGSSPGSRPEYLEAAQDLGRAMLARGTGLVYGGAGFGLMGRLAETVLAGGGEVIGVMPEALAGKEIALPGLTELRMVGSMHERKALMADLGDAFAALPGGLGTVEEILEVLTWAQLGIHRKPCGVLNVAGYFDHLLRFLDHATEQRFLSDGHRALLLESGDPHDLLDRLTTYEATEPDKVRWIRKVNQR